MLNAIKKMTLISFLFLFGNLQQMELTAQNDQTNQEYETQVGLRTGLNFHGLSGADTNGDIGLSFGVWAAKRKSKWFGWKTELLYLEQGGQRSVDFLGFDFTANFNLDYVAVPVMVTVHPASFIHLEAGIQPGFAIKTESVTSSFLTGPQVETVDDIGKFDAAVIIGLNVKVPYWDGHWAFAARYRKGVNNIYTGGEEVSIKNRGLAITATYTVPLSDLLGN